MSSPRDDEDPTPSALSSNGAGAIGDETAERLYRDLRACAARLMEGQPPGHTLQPTALVNEAYLRLSRAPRSRWNDRLHFLAAAATAMRSVLVDHARRRARRKRGSGERPLPLDRVVVEYERKSLDLVALDEALREFAKLDPVMSKAIEYRFFGGLSTDEIAAALGVSKRQLERDWKVSVCWLRAAMR